MSYSVEQGDWLFRQFDTRDDETGYRFRFLRWVAVGDRDDLAAVEILDPWKAWDGKPVSHAIFAARHVGFDLRALETTGLPVHVHLMTSDADVADKEQFAPSDLSRTAWVTLEPVGADLPERPEFQAFTTRLDPSAR